MHFRKEVRGEVFRVMDNLNYGLACSKGRGTLMPFRQHAIFRLISLQYNISPA
jgi:hypothetical protein